MKLATMATRNDFFPSISVKGSHYEVGYQVGLKFKSMIHSYMIAAYKLNEVIFKFYETEAGKTMYNDNLVLLQDVFPDYVKEIEGIADGAEISFHKLFLLHLDAAYAVTDEELLKHSKIGCSTILCNQSAQKLIGHNEDAMPNALNHCYVVQAEITKVVEGVTITSENFTAFCYAGELPGFCMSYNNHGIAYSINIIQADVHCGKIPRHFICRAMLAAKDMNELMKVLQSHGYGINDGMGVNLGIQTQSSLSLFSIEVGPNPSKNDESLVDVYEVKPGESYLHCNSFKRISLPCPGRSQISSQHREETYKILPPPVDEMSTLNVLGNQSDPEYSFFRDGNEQLQVFTVSTDVPWQGTEKIDLFRVEEGPLHGMSLLILKNISATDLPLLQMEQPFPCSLHSSIQVYTYHGIFNFTRGDWTLYSKNPKTAKPIAMYRF